VVTVTDISAIDAALMARLTGDPALMALCPDGVHWDLGPQGASAFVMLVRPATTERELALGGDGWEKVSYAVIAVMKTGGAVPAGDAAFRIHELLHLEPLDLSAGGYTHMITERLFPIRYSEVDVVNAGIRWQHYGGQYQIQVCPNE
jgi:hypothetical protein